VYKSVGADGKVVYSDHPSDNTNASVSVIKADVVQAVAKPATEAAVAPAALRLAVLAALAADAAPKGAARSVPAPKQVCDKMVTVVVSRNGDILKTLPAKGLLSAFKTN
jgi:hypothetical protein